MTGSAADCQPPVLLPFGVVLHLMQAWFSYLALNGYRQSPRTILPHAGRGHGNKLMPSVLASPVLPHFLIVFWGKTGCAGMEKRRQCRLTGLAATPCPSVYQLRGIQSDLEGRSWPSSQSPSSNSASSSCPGKVLDFGLLFRRSIVFFRLVICLSFEALTSSMFVS